MGKIESSYPNTWWLTVLLITLLLTIPSAWSAEHKLQSVNQKECVILLHGLARTAKSLAAMGATLNAEGYMVVNVEYPSRKHTIEVLANRYISDAIKQCYIASTNRIHFVTHSMGGILVRFYLKDHNLALLGNVVMLSPPNQGSEVVDKLGSLPGFYLLNGPAGQQLGTGETMLPKQLGAVNYPVGVITGNKSINLVLSMLIPGNDDGKVSVENAKLTGMTDFLVVQHTHPFIMNSKNMIRQTLIFLRYAKFL